MHRDSSLLYLSTEHATRRNADFFINISNSTSPTKVRKVVPVSVTIPNIFPNVNRYRNTWQENGGPEITIPEGQYDIDSLAAAFTAASTNLTMTVNGGVLEITNNTAGSVFMESKTTDIFDMLGFHDAISPVPAFPPPGTVYRLTFSALETKTAGLPNLGGEKMVFVTSQKLAHGSTTFGGDSVEYNILANISFHNVDYGQTAHFEVNELKSHEIDWLHHNNIDTVEMTILDSKFRPLLLPGNYHMRIVLRIFHQDSMSTGKG